MENIKEEALRFIQEVNKIEKEQDASIKSKEKIEADIESLMKKAQDNRVAMDIGTHAIEILRGISDESVSEAYKFLEDNINAALSKMFTSIRQIKLVEYTRANQYPQLEFQLIVEDGEIRSINEDSGHGISQIVSLLSILCLIVITKSRKLVLLDEVLSGVSVNNLRIIDEILWAFTKIGFQFLINEHGFIPKGAHVYHMAMKGKVGFVESDYIAEEGVYLQSNSTKKTKFNYTKEEIIDNKEGNELLVADTQNVNEEVVSI